jgi:hypothetical protein
MNSADYVNCRECRAPLLPDDPNTYVRVTAWERKSASPSRRGGSDVVLRQRLEEFLCSTCVAQAKRGLAPLQESLLGVGV